MTDENRLHRLSRRRVLGGLGAVGLASAGAGLGTSAYFSDTESFENNVLTAGTLDLLVGYYSYWDQGNAGSGAVSGTANGSAVTAELSDVKPGDSGLLAFCPTIETNPAYLWLCGELTSNAENGMTEPEGEVDDTPDVGELADSIQVDVNYCDVANDVGDSFDPGDVTHVADVWEGTLAEFLSNVQDGVPLDGDANSDSGESGFLAPGDQECFAGSDAESANHCLCVSWTVPTDVGNEAQSDSLGFDLEFHAEQCRHNDGTHNPCSEGDGEEPVPDAVSISATPDTAGATDSIHRVEVPVGSGLGGDSLSTLTVDYPADFDVGGVGTGDVLGAGVERADTSIDAVTVSGTVASDGDTAVQFSLDGSVTVAAGDTVFIEYRDATNASTADDYSVVVDVNGGEIGPGTLTLVPASATPGPVTSTFDGGDDGWKITGDAQGGASVPDHEPSTGNPAPSISATDDVQGGTWYFEAPGKFLGGKSGFYGGTLAFDLMQEFTGTASQFDNVDVSLSGGGVTLTYDTSQNPGNGTSGVWTSYSVTLHESDNWMVGGSAATQNQIQTVLADLKELRIRGEYRSGSDKGYLDNVSMQP